MRRGLISAYVLGVLLTVCAALSGADRTVRITIGALGWAAVVAAVVINQVAIARINTSQPYTTTDWLRGKRRPGGAPQSRVYFLINVLVGCGWAASLVFPEPVGTRHWLRIFILTGYLAMGGYGVLQKPDSVGDPAASR